MIFKPATSHLRLVILNLFQDNRRRLFVILKRVQDDEGGILRVTRGYAREDKASHLHSTLTQNLRLRVAQCFAQSLQTPLDAV